MGDQVIDKMIRTLAVLVAVVVQTSATSCNGYDTIKECQAHSDCAWSHWGCVDKTLAASDASASVSCSNPEQCLEIDMADGFASQFWLDQGYKYNHTLHPECTVGKCDRSVYPSHESTEPIKGYTGVEQLKYGKPPATIEAFSNKPLVYVQVQCFDKKCKEDCNGGPIPQKTCIGSTGGGAAMLECFPTYLQQQLWTNGDCTGPASNTTKQLLNKCEMSSEGEYYENLCTHNNALPAAFKHFKPSGSALRRYLH